MKQLESGGLFLILQLIAKPTHKDNASLRSWLHPGQPLSPREALTFTLHIARGFRYATATVPSLVHLDLKPENVLVGGDGLTRVSDFGLALTRQTSVHRRDYPPSSKHGPQIVQSSIAGTPHYMAPEQWIGAGVDCRTDMYALGCILKELTTGLPPVPGRTVDEIATAHLTSAAAADADVAPPAIAAVIRRLVGVDVAHRPSEWPEVVRAIEIAYARVVGVRPADEPAVTDQSAKDRAAMQAREFLTIANGYERIGNHETAKSYRERALRKAQSGHDRLLLADAQNGLASSLSHLGDIAKAMRLTRDAAQAYLRERELRYAAGALGNLGRLHRLAGEPEKGLAVSEQALLAFRELRDRKGEAVELLLQANTYAGLKNSPRAVERHLESMKIADSLKDEMLLGANCFRFGLCLSVSGRWHEARVMLRYALLLYARAGHRQYLTETRDAILKFRAVSGFSNDEREVALDRLFELGATPAGVRTAATEHPLLRSADIVETLAAADLATTGLESVSAAIRELAEILRSIADIKRRGPGGTEDHRQS